jgi:signal transduction histidine kinase
LQNLDVEKKTALLAAQYEYAQKEIALKAEHDQAQRTQWWINGGTAALLLMMSGVAIFVYRSRRRLKEAFNELERSNQELQEAKADIQTKNEELTASEEELRQTAEELMVVNERIMDEKRKTDDAFKALQEAKGQLVQAEKMASLGQLTAGIAHEINNPVNFIAGGAQGLRLLMGDAISLFEKYRKLGSATDKEALVKEIEALREKIGPEEELKADVMGLLEDIQKGADRVTEIVRGLRNFSRSDNELRISDQLHDNINNTLLVLRNKYKDRIEIIKNFDPSIGSIECFPGQLSQVFMNIISNGIEAIDGKGQITISTKDAGPHVQVFIKDTGPGIPEEIRSRIFDPFFTTKEVGKGTGLGLSIVHGIIEKHKGSIEVFSEEGKGTTFLITLPK